MVIFARTPGVRTVAYQAGSRLYQQKLQPEAVHQSLPRQAFPESASRCNRLRWVLALLFCLLQSEALSHSASTAFVTLSEEPAGVRLRLDLSVADTARLAPIDANADQSITWGELSDARPLLAEQLNRGLILVRGDRNCAPQTLALAMTEHAAEPYVVLQRNYTCNVAGALRLNYQLLFDLDASHRALVRIDSADSERPVAAVLSPQQRSLVGLPARHSGFATFTRFWAEGAAHILAGFDHLLFLATLLLPCVMVRRQRSWEPCEAATPALYRVLMVVTAFTLGHSVTLGLVVLDFIPHPGAWIETAIALSIVLAALNNLMPLFSLPGWVLAGSLGLLHGFGFAGALQGIGLPGGAAILPLLGFNLGVESGQLLVVAALLPLLLYMRRQSFYRRGILAGGSCCAALLACVWMLQTLGIIGPLTH